MTDQPAPAKPQFQSTLLRAFVPLLVLNTVIATGITLFGDHGFASNLLYSQCIGLLITVCIDIGRYLLVRDWPDHMVRLVGVVPVSVVLGYVGGGLVAGTLLGDDTFQYWTGAPNKAIGMLFMSLVAGAALTYFFVSREMLAAARQKAEAAQRQAAESRLKLLETQLEPHMLFNTLANLRALIGVDPDRAQTMLDHMIAYLRATLSASRASTHTLEQEFARLTDYLALMAVRMGPRLQYTLELPEALHTLPVPPLLLQPLVENSIRHGLEPKVEGGSITVRAHSDGSTVTLEVEDTGLGLHSPDTTGSRFGLAQVRERLSTVYGAAGTMDLIAGHVGGVRARITFPLQT